MAGPQVREALWLDLGTVGFEAVYALQQELAARRRSGDTPDIAIAVEHTSCVTLGRRAKAEHLLADVKEMAVAGITVHRVDRGGDVTYHGPGQLVCYAITDLAGYGRDVHAHARRLEEIMIRAAAACGVPAYREPGYPGVWCSQGKLGALGFGVRRWVTMHGASLNVSPHLPHYDLIVPCGIRDRPVTSLERAAGRRVEMERARSELKRAFGTVFGVRLRDAAPDELGFLSGFGPILETAA